MNAIERWKAMTKAMCFGARPEATQARKERLWRDAEVFIDMVNEDGSLRSWDDGLGDEAHDFFYDLRGDIYVQQGDDGWYKESSRYFANHLIMALRAGVDAATGSGMGVIGFTVGDVREMFGGEIPEWFNANYKADLASVPADAGIGL